jgi:hypothetical protein
MSARVWMVTIGKEMPVWAATEEEARKVAEEFAREEIRHNGIEVGAAVAVPPDAKLPWGWSCSIPWGLGPDDDRTIADLLREPGTLQADATPGERDGADRSAPLAKPEAS